MVHTYPEENGSNDGKDGHDKYTDDKNPSDGFD